MRERLCSTFRYISGKVWRLLGDSNYYGLYCTSRRLKQGLGWSEETLTDIVLLEISRRHPYEVYTLKFNKQVEAQEGADWEWIILSESGILRLRFQAKRIHIERDIYEYSTLNYKKNGQYQVDILIDRASRTGAIPLYIFYNVWDIDFEYKNFVGHLSLIPSCCRYYSKTNFGITIASAFEVRKLVTQNPSQKSLSSVLSVSWPLHCLACCRFSDLSKSIYNFILEYVMKDIEEYVKNEISRNVIHDKLPKDVLSRFKGVFSKESPMFTTFIVDSTNPHREAFEAIKEFFKKKD